MQEKQSLYEMEDFESQLMSMKESIMTEFDEMNFRQFEQSLKWEWTGKLSKLILEIKKTVVVCTV